jgi:cytochrome c2
MNHPFWLKGKVATISAFPGMPKEQDRLDVIAYLKSVVSQLAASR